MLRFPNAKINLGLNITAKRADGYHNLETVFFPIPVTDVLEIVHAEKYTNQGCNLFLYGIAVEGNDEDNLCVRAYHLLKKDFKQLPAVDIHLYKNIPMGAGLGGGSADGAFMLSMLNEKFNLNISRPKLIEYALMLGSDCPFFILNKPCFASGRGEVMEELNINLNGYKMVIVNPGIHVNTKEAFSKITPSLPASSIKDIVKKDVSEWKELLVNDFEKPVFEIHSSIKEIKEVLYKSGGLYASMTGTGSTVYALFAAETSFDKNIFPKDYFVKEMVI